MPPACTAVRELLPEHALGVLPARDRVAVDAHVEWCAGCRKEAEELAAGAATLGLSLAPAAPPAGLDDAIVGLLRAPSRGVTARRRARAAAAGTIAAMVALSGLGWGAVMAGRAERAEARAAQELADKQRAIEIFEKLLAGRGGLIATLRDDETHLGRLIPVGDGGVGGGFVLQLVSPSIFDFVLVHVSGLPADPARAPYRVFLENAEGDRVKAGRIEAVDQVEGTGESFKEFEATDLTGYTTVLVHDASGELVLRGTIDVDPQRG